jgi:hypothetical protein
MEAKVLWLDAAERPEDIPAAWLIFNASRPLCGTKRWTGEFRRGVFYVAIDPAAYRAPDAIRQTIDLDGALCKYITVADMRESVLRPLFEAYPEAATDEHSDAECWQLFYGLRGTDIEHIAVA